MKPSAGCKLIGAQQALSGIGGAVVLMHSVVGCSFGTMGLHLPNAMDTLRQTCTVISDEDIIFGGEALLEKALASAAELYRPRAVFLLSGCVSEITNDDIAAAVDRAGLEIPVLQLPAAGFSGDFAAGYEQGLRLLAKLIPPPAEGKPAGKPAVNLIGWGADDPRAGADLRALRELLADYVEVVSGLAVCDWNELDRAGSAGLNIVFGRGEALARELEARFAIPYEVIDYPYGATGVRALYDALSRHFHLPGPTAGAAAAGLRPVYAYLQALYGMPAAVIGEAGRARGLRRFLEQELGMEVAVYALREETADLELFYDRVRGSEAALLFGSSFEQEICDELEIPLVRYDYPVFDEISISGAPFVGPHGTVCLVEQILNQVMRARNLKGALYQ